MDYVLFACPTQENTYKLKLAAYTFAHGVLEYLWMNKDIDG